MIGWLRERRWTVAGLAALTVLAFAQQPGRATFDTKLDLAVDPVGFMARSLHLWNPWATSGELQNQAYGYLVPMGPFFAAGQLLGLPVWFTQRLWCALLFGVAFVGVLLLARALRIGTEGSRHAAALAYALAPRMLTEIGTLSSEMLPAALLPFVLLPLVRVDRIGSPRRAAGLSALAVLAMGGINAAMVLLALVLPGLYLVTRRFTRDHLRLVAWWCAGVLSVVLWWFVPLLLLGRFSLPFLSYIESAATTTGVTSTFQVVRGTNQWVAYVVEGVPWWPAGWLLVDNPVLLVATAAVGGIGLVGLALPRLPERGFLMLGMLAGVVLLTVGFVGTLDSPLSGVARGLLDGPLAPFRNVHKLEPVLRLPLVLGFAHAVAAAARWRAAPARAWVAPAAVGLVVVVAAPAWLLHLRPGPGWTDIPAHWHQAADWLAEHDPAGRTLVVPGSGFGHYTWGRTVDEPIQPLARTAWALRNQVPLGSEGNTRVLDTVEAVLSTGRGSPALAGYLTRNGFRYLLLRNDLDRARTQAPPAAVLRAALAASPGVRLAASFGPPADARPEQRSPVDDTEAAPPAIEVYDTGAPVPRARTVDAADVATVSGGPESLLPALEQGLLAADRPAVLAGDGAGGTARVVTDGLRRRERNVGRVRDNVSQTMTADEESRQRRAALDLLPFEDEAHRTVAAYSGIRAVTASSAASYADAPGGGSQPSYQPFAALDGDDRTAWHSASFGDPRGQWLQVDLGTPRRIDAVGLSFVDDVRVGWPVARFALTTEYGTTEHDVGAGPYPLPPGGLVTTVRVTVLELAGDAVGGNVGIRSLTLPGVEPSRSLRAPADVGAGDGGPPAYAFTREHHARPACFPADGAVRCDPGLARVGEEPGGLDRLFRTPLTATYGLSVTAVARPGGRTPAPPEGVTAEASSWLAGDPRVGPWSAVDGDPRTAWLADIGDRDPRLRVRWDGEQRVDRLTFRLAGPPVAARPTVVEVLSPTEAHVADVRADGSVRFPAMTTDRLDIRVVAFDSRVFDRRGNRADAVPGFAEVTVPGVDRATVAPEFAVPCGKGPVVELDDIRFRTAVSGTLADYLSGRPLSVRICDLFAADDLRLGAGEHRLRSTPSDSFVVQDATLRPTGWAAAAPAGQRATTVDRWDETARAVTVAPGGQALLVVPENANAGWTARLGGVPLAATRVDGWQQAWIVPAGDGGTVTLDFTPDRTYRAGLAAGAAAVLVALLMAALPVRRRRPVAAPRPIGGYAVTIALAVLAVALGGVPAAVLLIAAVLLRQVRPRLLVPVAAAGMAVATAVTVVERLAGHGQAGAYGAPTQLAMLAAVCAVVAAAVRVPGAPLHQQPDGDEEARGDGGGGRDLAHAAVQPGEHQNGLDGGGHPDGGHRPQLGAGDPGVQQDLRDGEQQAGQREQPQRGGRG
ncbi:alpha-(1-_3)-arabinofuranosyltransferase [Spirilliplanes yamanashiensis]|uniref:Coagulation factor 5/8 type n=1 Tax=Spirilliplanes yamanashiensis TaxID=42233 RepID=A0A8J4DHR2_9ACTN|nr:alpha-(1->3)-arabinofuranosyltransferase [Spirilliplanes yamanashiensis]GIJ02066.1 coagulation factor 5/8 type [Spirilliplanes yamanashiensis]